MMQSYRLSGGLCFLCERVIGERDLAHCCINEGPVLAKSHAAQGTAQASPKP